MEGKLTVTFTFGQSETHHNFQDKQFGGVEGWWGLFNGKYVSTVPLFSVARLTTLRQ